MISLLAVALWLAPCQAGAVDPAADLSGLGSKSPAAFQLRNLTQGPGEAGSFQAVSALPIRLPAPPPAVIKLPAGVEPAAAKLSEYFSDETDIKTELVQAVDSSKKTIEAALFGITLTEVAEALVRARDRGVAVRVVMNQNHVFPQRTRSKEVQFLMDKGIDMRTARGNRSYGVQHNKICVFDGKLLKTGSFNWTFSANNYNYENAIFTTEPGYVAGFSDYWRWMWDRSRPVTSGPVGEFPENHFTGAPPCKATVSFNGVALPACAFSPQGQTEAHLIRAIQASRDAINVASYSFYSQNLADALVAARDRGLKVRVLVDKEMGKKSQITRFFLDKGIAVRWLSGRGKGSMHHKYAVFDGKLLETGSHNWTNNAELNDFENALLTAKASTVGAYTRKFEELYGRAAVPTIEQLPAPEKVEGSAAAAE
ncbi:MAG: hypothetical protein HY748_00075 [Elusimicrobia bacterium]|nr:hypothetical protein [Elusimicrobiota bacterium]